MHKKMFAVCRLLLAIMRIVQSLTKRELKFSALMCWNSPNIDSDTDI